MSNSIQEVSPHPAAEPEQRNTHFQTNKAETHTHLADQLQAKLKHKCMSKLEEQIRKLVDYNETTQQHKRVNHKDTKTSKNKVTAKRAQISVIGGSVAPLWDAGGPSVLAARWVIVLFPGN